MNDNADHPTEGERRPAFDAANPPAAGGSRPVSTAWPMGVEEDQFLSMMQTFFSDLPPWEIVTAWQHEVLKTTNTTSYLLPDVGQLGSAEAAAIAAEGVRALYSRSFSDPSVVAASSYMANTDIPELLGIVEYYSTILGSIAAPIDITRPVSDANRALGATVLNANPRTHADRVALASQIAGAASETGIKILQPDWQPDTPLSPVGVDRLDVLLGAIHPDLPAKRHGAWLRIREGGPDAVAQAAHSLVELVDWTLRLMAPEDEVIRWVDTDPKMRRELAGNGGRPTRAMKAQYLVRDHPEHRPETAFFVKAVAGLTRALQVPKHSLGAQRALDSYAMAVEGALLFLLTPPTS